MPSPNKGPTVKFTLALQAAGLSLKTVSLGAVTVLRELSAKPLPLSLPVRDYRSERNRANNAKPLAIGPLIRHGLAELSPDTTCYQITDKGRAYLAKVEGFLPNVTTEAREK